MDCTFSVSCCSIVVQVCSDLETELLVRYSHQLDEMVYRESIYPLLLHKKAGNDVSFYTSFPADDFFYTVAISISVSFFISVFSRLVIRASAVSMAVSTLTPVSIAFLRITNPSFE